MNRQQEILRQRKELHTQLALLGACFRSCIDSVKFQGVYNQLVLLPWLNADEEQTSAHHFSSYLLKLVSFSSSAFDSTLCVLVTLMTNTIITLEGNFFIIPWFSVQLKNG